MKQAYSLVIDLLMTGKVDFKAIGLELAKSDPTAFLTMYSAGKKTQVEAPTQAPRVGIEEMNRELRAIWAEGNRVSAIKRCREITGWGLKEAKDWCEQVNEGHNPAVANWPFTPAFAVPAAHSKVDTLDEAISKLLEEASLAEAVADAPAYESQGAFS